jgi:glycosyltransferase involved in cell wall biosynthesis
VDTADHVLADSNHTRQDLIERLMVVPERITTVHLAAGSVFTVEHSPETVSDTLARFRLQPGYVLFVGTLSPRKNVETILDAFELMVMEADIDAKLVLAGSKGWLADDLFASLRDSAVSDRIVHLTGLEDSQMAHIYSRAGVLVIPSLYEGFGLPALEAMHCGCPVIASNRSSLPEVVGEAGILLNPMDVVAWADNIARVLEEPKERQRLVALGAKQARNFSWQKTAAETLAVYEKCSD